MDKQYKHPGLAGFLKRYKHSDLVPAVEIIGAADWYEDELDKLEEQVTLLNWIKSKYTSNSRLEKLVVFLASRGIVSTGKMSEIMGIPFSEFHSIYSDKIGVEVGKQLLAEYNEK